MTEQEIKKLWDNKTKFKLNNKDYTFREVYQKTIDTLLPTVEFKENDYQQILKRQKNSVYNINNCNNKLEWSWMNSINTNYSCVTFLINEINRIILTDNLDYDIIRFSDIKNFGNEFIIFYNIMSLYKNIIFQPNNDINSVFNKMKYKTQETWYDGKIAEIFLAQNIRKYIDDVEEFVFDFERGKDDDMNNGVDLMFKNSENKSFTIQNKKGRSPREEYDNYVFYTYYKKSYSNLDFFVIANYRDNILYIIKNLGNFGNGIKIDSNNYNILKVNKNLVMKKINNNDALDNELSMTLYQLLTYCCKNNIEYSMGVPDDKINKVTFNEEKKTVYIEYIDFNDNTFLDKVKEIFEKIKTSIK